LAKTIWTSVYQKKGRKINYENITAFVKIENSLDYIQKFWDNGVFYEASSRDLLTYISNRYIGGVFIDIGSNIGNHTLFFSLVCKANRVISIEPYPNSYKLLQENIKLNGLEKDKVSLFNVALDQKEGYLGMTLPNNCNTGMAFVSGDGDIKATTLDTIIRESEISAIRLIKIDCEGYNKQILAGSRDVLKRFKPDIFMECETESELQSLDQILQEFSYFRVPWFKLNATPTYFWTKDFVLAERYKN
jgi:protein O-GlcNAc transferase